MAMVSGTLRLSNGELPSYFLSMSDSFRLAAGELSCEGTILGGHISVRIDGLQREMLDDDVLRIAGHIMDNLALTQTVTSGAGTLYTIESYWKDAGLVLRVVPETAPPVEPLGHDDKELYGLISDSAQLRYAIRDFNQGMVYSQDSPYFLYRAVETLVRLICEKDDFQNIGKKDWKSFHRQIGTTYDELKELHTFLKRQRHGSNVYFTRSQYTGMMKTTRLFLIRTIQFLLEEGF
jgi:hypothetical protein